MYWRNTVVPKNNRFRSNNTQSPLHTDGKNTVSAQSKQILYTSAANITIHKMTEMMAYNDVFKGHWW